jgi:chemotaxis protein methyltransferase WspC
MAQIDFEKLLKDAIGLDTASIGGASVERAVQLRMARLGLGRAEDYWQQVCTSTDERQQLIEAVVVTETWFFRDREAFAALVRLAMNKLQPAETTRALRLLSVPCSSGEEPFSMVMSLLDAGMSPQQFQMDASDVSARALARAKRATYGRNSFRGTDLGFRERYFQSTGKDYALLEQIRELVTFRQGNLLSADFCFRHEPYDVVFCRNLLIYFDRSTQQQAIEHLARLLAPEGVLFVGPAEAYVAGRGGFAPVNQAMSFAFRKTAKNQARTQRAVPSPTMRREGPRALRPTVAKIVSAPPSPPRLPFAGIEAARDLADAGRLSEAADWCEKSLLENGPSAEAYYILGLVRDAMGDRDGAVALYRKAIYLEPEHVEGLLQLALMTEARGDSGAAKRLRERALRVERRTTEAHLTVGGGRID